MGCPLCFPINLQILFYKHSVKLCTFQTYIHSRVRFVLGMFDILTDAPISVIRNKVQAFTFFSIRPPSGIDDAIKQYSND